jgi:hypothetical protein
MSGSGSDAKITPASESWWTNTVSRRWWLEDIEMEEKMGESTAAGTEISAATEIAAITEDPSSEELGGRGERILG